MLEGSNRETISMSTKCCGIMGCFFSSFCLERFDRFDLSIYRDISGKASRYWWSVVRVRCLRRILHFCEEIMLGGGTGSLLFDAVEVEDGWKGRKSEH